MITFVSGGARSGKSGYAEALAHEYEDVTYIATALAFDPEMEVRIAAHRARRPAHWKTLEAYKGVGEAVAGMSGCVLIDCLTVMISNLMMEAPLAPDMKPACAGGEFARNEDYEQSGAPECGVGFVHSKTFDWDGITSGQMAFLEDYVMGEMKALCEGLSNTAADVILVTNELGMGLVPAYPLGRVFRDIAGRANAMFAGLADSAVFMVSGLPLRLK